MEYISLIICSLAAHLGNSQRIPFKGTYNIAIESNFNSENKMSCIIGEIFDGCNDSSLYVEGYAFTSLESKAVFTGTDSTNLFNLMLPTGFYVIKFHALGFTTVVTDTIFLKPNSLMKINFYIGTWECP